MKQIRPVFIVLICGLMMVACVKKITEKQLVLEKPSHTMVIAGDSSEFKNHVRERIINKYKETATIYVMNIADLKDKEVKNIDVVVIMDTCMAWSGFNPSLKAFLDQEENKKKTVLSITAGDPHWAYTYKGVDAITSASVVENEDQFFNRIDAQIQAILKKK